MNWEKLKPWAVPVLALLVIGILAFVWNREHRTRLQLAQDLEKAHLQASDLLVENQKKDVAIAKDAQELLNGLTDKRTLQAQIDALKQAAADVKPIEVVKWRTVPAQGTGDPLPQQPPAQPGPDGKCPECPACLFAPGNTAHIEVGELTFQTGEKNHVMLGEADFIRDTPTRSMIYHSTIETKMSQASMEKLVFDYRWGAGAMVVGAKDGWAFGPKVLFPPFHILGLQGEADAGFGLGPNGQYAFAAGAGLRWR